MSGGDSGSLDEGSLAEASKAAGDENLSAGVPEPMRTCLLCEVDANRTTRESLTDRWGHSDELTAKTRAADDFGKEGQEGLAWLWDWVTKQRPEHSFSVSFMFIVCVCVCVCVGGEEKGGWVGSIH